jgi:diketogulonate reductase-like aldo/keto reductase
LIVIFYFCCKKRRLTSAIVIPIPGTRVVARLEENAHAAEITLSPDDVAALDKWVHEADVHGARNPEWRIPDGDCIELSQWNY